jgi:hypothetical protein
MVIGCSNKIKTGRFYSRDKFIWRIKEWIARIFFIPTRGNGFEITQSKISISEIFIYIPEYGSEIETIF